MLSGTNSLKNQAPNCQRTYPVYKNIRELKIAFTYIFRFYL